MLMGMFCDRSGPWSATALRSLIASSTVSIVRLSIRICDLRRISIRPSPSPSPGRREGERENLNGGRRRRLLLLKSRGIFLSRPEAEARSKPVSRR